MPKKNNLQEISFLLDAKLEPIHKTLKKHEKLLRSLKKDQGTILNLLDREQMDQRKRLKRVEDHLGFSSPSV